MEVPSGVAGVLLFILLLWPGFAYSSIRARRRPERQQTALRETVSIVSVSLTALVVTGILFAILRSIFPGATPNIDRLIFHSRTYLERQYVLVAWWALVLLALAVLGSGGIAIAQSSDRLSKMRMLRWFAAPPDPSTMSSWWVAFTEYSPADVEIHVGCTLDDGSYISGRLYSFSQAGDDTADRDLLLRDPIRVRPPGAASAQEMERAGLVAISARHLVTMIVTYVSRNPPEAAELSATQAQAP